VVLSTYWNGRPLSAADIWEAGGRLHLRVGMGRPDGSNDLYVVCDALVPRWRGSTDPRRLGLPIFGVAARPIRASMVSDAA
jgi:hypothetical protein